VMAQAYNLSPREAIAGGLGIPGQSGIHSETLPPKNKKECVRSDFN
jgi:hypothetical protein